MGSSSFLVSQIVLLVLDYVSLPILLYWYWRVYRLRKELYFAKRHFSLLVAWLVLNLVYLTVCTPLILFATFSRVAIYAVAVVAFFIRVVFAVRAYLCYFNNKYMETVIKNAWQRFIIEDDPNWFIMNKKRWGDLRFVAKIVGPACLFYLILWTVLFWTSPTTFIIMSGIELIVTLCFISMLFCKISPVNDHFYIRDEIRVVSIVGFGMVIALFIEYICVAANVGNEFLWVWFVNLYWSVGLFIASLMSTAWVIYVNHVSDEDFPLADTTMMSGTAPRRTTDYFFCCPSVLRSRNSMSYRLLGRAMDRSHSNQSGSSTSSLSSISSTTSSVTHVTLRQVLENDEGFNTFMRHVVREFSAEHLLFLVEFMHFQLSFDDAQFPSNMLRVEFPRALPRNSRLDSTQTEFNRGLYLYNKFLKTNESPHEVNIPGHLRVGLRRFFERDDPDVTNLTKNDEHFREMVDLLNRAGGACFSMIQGSFTRFTSYKDFEILRKRLLHSRRRLSFDGLAASFSLGGRTQNS